MVDVAAALLLGCAAARRPAEAFRHAAVAIAGGRISAGGFCALLLVVANVVSPDPTP